MSTRPTPMDKIAKDALQELHDAMQQVSSLRAQLAALGDAYDETRAENERLRQEFARLQAVNVMLRVERAEVERLRRERDKALVVVEAAKAWVVEAHARGIDPDEEHSLTAGLIAAVDALPATPEATDES